MQQEAAVAAESLRVALSNVESQKAQLEADVELRKQTGGMECHRQCDRRHVADNAPR